MTKSKKSVQTATGYTFWERNRLSDGYLLQKRITAVVINICRAILLFGMCFLILQPFLNKISISFMSSEDLYDPTVIAIPQNFTFKNYRVAANVMKYAEALKNSLIICSTIAIIQIVMCTLVGYGFARFKFPGKKILFALVILTILIPPQTISSSLVLSFRFFDVFGIIKAITGDTLNLKNSILPYYLMSVGCMGLKCGLYIYLVRQYFRNIPYDLEEAAYIDGCGTLKTFTRIMLPQAKPIITSCFLFAFVWQWTDGYYSKLFLGNKILIGLSISRIVDSLGVYISRDAGVQVTVSVAYANCIQSTGVLMIVLPVIVLYLFAQKQFVESLSSTGIKM